jgi:hypothetical protein
LHLEEMPASCAVARLWVGGKTVEADDAATPATDAVPPCVHSGQGGLGLGECGLCGRGEFLTDLTVRGDAWRASRFGGDVAQLLTSEQAMLVQARPENGEFGRIEAMVVDSGDLMGHDWFSPTGDKRIVRWESAQVAACSTGALLAPHAEAHVGQDLETLDGDSGLAGFAGSVGAVGQTPSGGVDLFEDSLDRGCLSRLQVFVRMRRGLFDRPQLGEAGVALVLQAPACFVSCEVLGAPHVGGH